MIYNYQKDDLLSTNQLLILCGSLHSVYCMIRNINEKKTKPVFFHYNTKIVSYHVTLTNLSFVFISDTEISTLFDKIHSDYCNYVMLNPFYIMDMPINCKKFNPAKYFN